MEPTPYLRANEPWASLVDAWRVATGRTPRHLAMALVLLVGLLAGLVARGGTTAARGTGAGLMLVLAAVLIGVWRRDARVWSSRTGTLRRVLVSTDPVFGMRALRALALVQEAERGSLNGSAELAHWHLDRLLAQASREAVFQAATLRSKRLGRWTAALYLATLGTLMALPMWVIEGWDVLLARQGRAPLALTWLNEVRISAQPPAYLRWPARALLPGDEVDLPMGSVVSVAGVPVHPGRHLVLTDGKREVRLVGDGRGGLVAHYALDQPAKLRVGARFGDVLIEQTEPLQLTAVVDEAPRVELAGTPRTVKLSELERLELNYQVSDDHGIKQVDLVLRSGEREDRRMLARRDGEMTSDRGGHVLTPRDRFFRSSALPVMISIEAKDNDTIRGPKWGKSAALEVIPPIAGESEVARLHALIQARDGLVDLLAWQLTGPHPRSEEVARTRSVARTLEEKVDRVHSGLGLPGGIKNFLRGRAQALRGVPRGSARHVDQTETAVLAVDVVVNALGQRDARATARRLGVVGEEVAQGAKAARGTERHESGLRRMESALRLLTSGSRQLLQLGELGADLGSVALADLARIDRALAGQDLWHVELAARHLAARLRRPHPSFTAAWRGGVEAGGGAGMESHPASDADQHFNRWMHELEELAFEHASGLEDMERALGRAEQASPDEALRREASSRARNLRELASRLPHALEESSKPRGAGGIARQRAEAMADELERLALRRTVDNGRAALDSLAQTERLPEDPASDLDRDAVSALKNRVGQELAWAEQRLAEQRERSLAQARSPLKALAEREHEFAQRVRSLAERAQRGEAALPKETLRDLEQAEDFMREAGQALGQGQGERGLGLGRSAQDLLDNLGMGRTTDTEDGEQPDVLPTRRSRGSASGGGYVPEAKGDNAEGFRRRVLEGLGQAGTGRLGPAARRYAEGLLR